MFTPTILFEKNNSTNMLMPVTSSELITKRSSIITKRFTRELLIYFGTSLLLTRRYVSRCTDAPSPDRLSLCFLFLWFSSFSSSCCSCFILSWWSDKWKRKNPAPLVERGLENPLCCPHPALLIGHLFVPLLELAACPIFLSCHRSHAQTYGHCHLWSLPMSLLFHQTTAPPCYLAWSILFSATASPQQANVSCFPSPLFLMKPMSLIRASLAVHPNHTHGVSCL